MILALPMRPPSTSAHNSRHPCTASLAAQETPANRGTQTVTPFADLHAASTSSGQFDLPPDARKGKTFPHPFALVFDPSLNRIVEERGGEHRHRPPTPQYTSSLSTTKDKGAAVLEHTPVPIGLPISEEPKRIPKRRADQSWKDDFPGQIMKMCEIVARHNDKGIMAAHRLLSRYGTHAIARDLISGNEMLEKEAVAKLPAARVGYPGESARTLYLRDHAEEITEKFRKFHKLTRKQATDKLGHSLTPRVAEMLINPATFEDGALELSFTSHLGQKRQRTKGVGVSKGNFSASSAIVVESSQAHQHLSDRTPSQVLLAPQQQQQEYQHKQQQPTLHPSMSSLGTSSHAEDPDDIDFDAVMEWVQRKDSQRFSTDYAKRPGD